MKEDFNRGAIAVVRKDVPAFLKELGDNMCAVTIKYNVGKKADVASIGDVLKTAGGHVVKHSQSEFGDAVHVWTGATGIGELEKLLDVQLVVPYRNWNDPNRPPLSEFKR